MTAAKNDSEIIFQLKLSARFRVAASIAEIRIFLFVRRKLTDDSDDKPS
jgi:hypothetical protein